MTLETVLFAKIYTEDGGALHDVADEQEAVQKAMTLKGLFFTLVTMDCEFEDTPQGRKLVSGLATDETPLRYTNVDRIFDLRHLPAEYNRLLAQPALQDPVYADLRKRMVTEQETYRQIASLTEKAQLVFAYIADPRFRDAGPQFQRFTGLRSTEKAFDKAGQQLWPQAARP